MALNKISIETEKLANDVSSLREEFLPSVPDLNYEIDVLSQFKANLAQVEDLNMRLKFVLNEVSGLIKRK